MGLGAAEQLAIFVLKSALHKATQAFSNSVAETYSGVGRVTIIKVVFPYGPCVNILQDPQDPALRIKAPTSLQPSLESLDLPRSLGDIVSAIVTWWLRRNHSDGRRVGARQPERA